MNFPYLIKGSLKWRVVSAYICTVAVSMSHHTVWRVPRDTFRFGALPYLLLYTAAMMLIALPSTLLQIALGRLSQEDAVGVWRAVPFFKGIGYLKLFTSYLMTTYTVCYVALTTTLLLYSLGNTIPFWECTQLTFEDGSTENIFNASECLSVTFLSPVSDGAEYYVAVALVIIAICLFFPSVLFNPLTHTKRVFYILGPIVIVLVIAIAIAVGLGENITFIATNSNWDVLAHPYIWMSSITQALLTCHTAGGYLIAVSDTIYTTSNVQWISLSFVGSNLLTSWVFVVFWYSVCGDSKKDSSVLAMLVETYKMAAKQDGTVVWPLLLLVMIIASGVITVVCSWYPLCSRARSGVGTQRRAAFLVLSVGVAAASLAALAGRLPALTQLDALATPLLVAVITAVEILAFVFIYGQKTLVEDVEFITSRDLHKFWWFGWTGTPLVLVTVTSWWVTRLVLDEGLSITAWPTVTTLLVLGIMTFVVLTAAAVAVTHQQQYDIISKIVSTFKPSRQWGPRDPITHYYWLARREEISQGNRPSRSGWRLGQLARTNNFFNVTVTTQKGNYDVTMSERKRALSDDWFWTKQRRIVLKTKLQNLVKQRPRSLDLPRSHDNWIHSTKIHKNDNYTISNEQTIPKMPVETDMDEITIDCSDNL